VRTWGTRLPTGTGTGVGVLRSLESLRNFRMPEVRIDAARKTFLALASMYDTKESIADRIVRSIDTLRLRKEALLVTMEDVLAEALYELWPYRSRRPALRLDAMMAIGTLRFAKENWRKNDAARPLTHCGR
jgi:hypothetical protein